MLRSLFALLVLLALSGCAGVTRELSEAILDNPDPETVEAGLPSLLLVIDGLIHNNPDNEDILLAGAELYNNYAGIFTRDKERAKRLTARARQYADTALCEYRRALCKLSALPFDEFQGRLALVKKHQVPFLFGFATAWAGWIQARTDDLEAVADLPKVKAALERAVALDEKYRNGYAHLYLGVIGTLLPPALGGKPEEGRVHFERALTLTRGRDLLIKVEYARRYARLVYNRPLHDRLLNEVLAAPVTVRGLTLSNTLAQREAKVLLSSADKYF